MVVLGNLMGWVGWDWLAFQVGFAAGYAVVGLYALLGGEDAQVALILARVFVHPGIGGAMLTVGSFICLRAFGTGGSGRLGYDVAMGPSADFTRQ